MNPTVGKRDFRLLFLCLIILGFDAALCAIVYLILR
jgi:hypothetical protein